MKKLGIASVFVTLALSLGSASVGRPAAAE
jgi:hypothetical protein